MNNVIKIGKPYIRYKNSCAYLCAKILSSFNEKELYYEVNEKFGDFFLADRCDAFLIGLIHSAMHENLDIICDAPVTDQLLFQLRNYYIPTLSSNMDDMYAINIIAEGVPAFKSGDGVLTGNSGGVDSLYTILRYNKKDFKEFGVTHIIFNNIYFEDDNIEKMRLLFERDSEEKSLIAKETGLTFIKLFTNLFQFYKHPGIFNHYFALQYISAAYALGKLVKIFYFSSTFPVNKFSINQNEIVSSARFDMFTLDCASVSSLKIYSAGMETDRLGKMDYILDKPESKRHLQVCAIEQSYNFKGIKTKLNCGYCNKCGRTISLLYSKDLLNDYSDIFELSYFNKNKAKFIGKTLASDQKAFAKMVISELRKKKKLPFLTRFWKLMYSIRYHFAKNKKLVTIYHKIKGIKDV